MTDALAVPVAFLLACGIALVATPVVRRLALRFGFTDRPKPRRVGPLKPRLGGLAMLAGFVLTILLTTPLVTTRTPDEWARIGGLLAGSLIAAFLGALDDRFELPARPQLLAQLAISLLALASGIVIWEVANPFGTPTDRSLLEFPWWIALPFTIVWLMGAMNTINFVDGLDGLAGGVVAIGALVLGFHSLILPEPQLSIAVLAFALAGATIGFLPHNMYPSRITMGTTGALFLGYALASLSIIGGTKAATLLLVLGIPILDVGWILLRRLLSGQSPFEGDRRHLHYRLLDSGLSHRQIVFIVYALCALFGAGALLIESRVLKLSLLGLAALVLTVLLLWLGSKNVPAPGKRG